MEGYYLFILIFTINMTNFKSLLNNVSLNKLVVLFNNIKKNLLVHEIKAKFIL